jgi:hypothetical protein
VLTAVLACAAAAALHTCERDVESQVTGWKLERDAACSKCTETSATIARRRARFEIICNAAAGASNQTACRTALQTQVDKWTSDMQRDCAAQAAAKRHSQEREAELRALKQATNRKQENGEKAELRRRMDAALRDEDAQKSVEVSKVNQCVAAKRAYVERVSAETTDCGKKSSAADRDGCLRSLQRNKIAWYTDVKTVCAAVGDAACRHAKRKYWYTTHVFASACEELATRGLLKAEDACRERLQLSRMAWYEGVLGVCNPQCQVCARCRLDRLLAAAQRACVLCASCCRPPDCLSACPFVCLLVRMRIV